MSGEQKSEKIEKSEKVKRVKKYEDSGVEEKSATPNLIHQISNTLDRSNLIDPQSVDQIRI